MQSGMAAHRDDQPHTESLSGAGAILDQPIRRGYPAAARLRLRPLFRERQRPCRPRSCLPSRVSRTGIISRAPWLCARNARSARVFFRIRRAGSLDRPDVPRWIDGGDPAASSPAGCNAIPITAAMDMQRKCYRCDRKAYRCRPPADTMERPDPLRQAPVDAERRPLLPTDSPSVGAFPTQSRLSGPSRCWHRFSHDLA